MMDFILEDIISALSPTEQIGDAGIAITDIQIDSRLCKPGSVFFAISGPVGDGHLFIDKAIANGAVAVICEKIPATITEGITYCRFKDTQAILAEGLNTLYRYPSEAVKLVGVTGTNGKTTTATLLYRLFTALGYKAGLISTVVNIVGTDEEEATHTTPGPVELFALLRQMADAGCEYVFMEVSSHAVHQMRIKGITFAGGVFTNITRDHLDYHKTFDEYIRVKKTFFDMLESDAFALVNEDDRNGAVMVQNSKASKHTFSVKSFSDFKCKIIESHFEGTQLNICGADVWVNFIGEFNAYNLLAVYSTAILLGQEKQEILAKLSTLYPVAGRFQQFVSPKGIIGIVDYAHTPDALSNVLDAIRGLRTGNEQVITVVGCGGDRDPGKRPIMGRIAAEMSDRVIITADNPRSEDPLLIAEAMRAGVLPTHTARVLSIIDRREAIRTAVMLAQSGDIVLIAGKGHENYQIVKGIKSHFDDKEVLTETFNTL